MKSVKAASRRLAKPQSDSRFHGLCEAGSLELAAYLGSEDVDGSQQAYRQGVEQGLQADLDAMLREAERTCSQAPATARWTLCRHTLDELKQVRLDLRASMVSAGGEMEFVATLKRFDDLWRRWIREAGAAARISREVPR